MKTNIYIKVLAVVAVSLSSLACAPFKAHKVKDTAPALNNASLPPGNNNSGNGIVVTPGELDDTSSEIPDDPADGLQKISFDLTFGQIHHVTQARLNEALKSIIRDADCDSVGANEYRCGEIPFGEIVDANRKKILDIPIPKTSGKEGDISYQINAGNIPIYLSREQHKGLIDIPDLTERKVSLYYSSEKAGKDIFLKLNPQGNKLLATVCLVTPGLKAYSEKTTLSGHIEKSIAFLPAIRSDLTIDVDPGWVDIAATRVCSDILMELDDQNLPAISLKKVHLPKAVCSSHGGLTVNVKAELNGLWKFVGNILKLFRYDIEEMIAAEVKKQALLISQEQLDVTTEDIESGRWIAEFLGAGYLMKTVEDFSNQLRTQMVNQGWADLLAEEVIQTTCLSAINQLNLDANVMGAVFKICALAPKLEVTLFEDSLPHRDMGCYGNYFSVSKDIPENAWWENTCVIKNDITLVTDPKVEALYLCLAESWNQKIPPDQMCRDEVLGFVDALLAGQFDYLFDAQLIPKAPSTDALERLRDLAATHLGINLPPVAEIGQLFN